MVIDLWLQRSYLHETFDVIEYKITVYYAYQVLLVKEYSTKTCIFPG